MIHSPLTCVCLSINPRKQNALAVAIGAVSAVATALAGVMCLVTFEVWRLRRIQDDAFAIALAHAIFVGGFRLFTTTSARWPWVHQTNLPAIFFTSTIGGGIVLIR